MSTKLLSMSPESIATALEQGMLRVCVVGLGRIGLPTAAVFAKANANVLGIDINERVVQSVNSGKSHFKDEPGLDEIISDSVRRKKLVATSDVQKGVSNSDIIIISVPTPVDETKVPDYSYIKRACRDVGRSLQEGSIVVIESSVGPGTVETLLRPILEDESGLKAGYDFGLASCPERSDPGNIIKNMFSVPRVVGATDRRTCDIVAEIYRSVFKVDIVKVSNPKTANAVKLTENLFRDVNIALANEFALLFEELGIDAVEVINACSTKYNFMPHYPGAGVGGPCLPSNPYYLISEGVKTGNIPYLIRLAREINDRMPDHIVELTMEALNELGKTVRYSNIAILGISYKPEVKDVQLAPSEKIVKKLVSMDATLSLYDPWFKNEDVFGLRVKETLEEAINDVDCIVLLTAHKEFRNLDLEEVARKIKKKIALVDGRNCFDPKLAVSCGFVYRGVGRKGPWV
jgi:nucleotide sugar dehydrogenase